VIRPKDSQWRRGFRPGISWGLNDAVLWWTLASHAGAWGNNECVRCVQKTRSRGPSPPARRRARKRCLTCLFGLNSDYCFLAAPRRVSVRIERPTAIADGA